VWYDATLLQELARYEIDVRNIVINQLIFPEAGEVVRSSATLSVFHGNAAAAGTSNQSPVAELPV
jgi:hypothetical protein